jgi:Cu/Ag efflux pump CusA
MALGSAAEALVILLTLPDAFVGGILALSLMIAGALSVGHAQAGLGGGPPVILLHGWPYDI